MALSHFVHVFQGERTRCQIARICVFFVAFHVELFKVFIADDALTTHNYVAHRLDFARYSRYGRGQMCNVCAHVPIAPCHHFRQFSVVKCDDKGQSVQLPTEPNWATFRPFRQLFGLLGLGQ